MSLGTCAAQPYHQGHRPASCTCMSQFCTSHPLECVLTAQPTVVVFSPAQPSRTAQSGLAPQQCPAEGAAELWALTPQPQTLQRAQNLLGSEMVLSLPPSPTAGHGTRKWRPVKIKGSWFQLQISITDSLRPLSASPSPPGPETEQPAPNECLQKETSLMGPTGIEILSCSSPGTFLFPGEGVQAGPANWSCFPALCSPHRALSWQCCSAERDSCGALGPWCDFALVMLVGVGNRHS